MPECLLTDTVHVAVHAVDEITRAGLVSYLGLDHSVHEILPAKIQDADVIVVAVDAVDASTLQLLRGLSNAPGARFAIVSAKNWRVDVSAAIDCGVRAVLWRDAFTPVIFIRTLLTIAGGGGSLPPDLQGSLMSQVQWFNREVLAPRDLTASGVSPREVDVLRLVAEGKEIAEIAAKLSYSERTVKSTLYGLMKRLRLRNRAHAVSYAIRAGVI
ncbi:DNA-binding NarL/FixJ family response regulator [Streptomyces aurantiacus]|uniref:helix-turn-helix transcriptional regulator n=1 Tax=Streptomyces aurantiacus TaxID=47760 RepID=UPI0027929524|nr:response regulator transcription factor [Streptomyces aurantiacus]MDQ0779946.1 DNA-binding NarL/FixJ family response regulator [Streptomyces aurantiacus]